MNQGRFARLLAIVLLSALAGAVRADELRVTLGGHVLPALSDARVSPTPKVAVTDGAPISLTIVLRRTDEEGFQRFLAEVYDLKSSQYGKFASSAELAERFGPSAEDYSAVEQFFLQQGFSIVEQTANRMTLTVSGSRATVERALGVRIDNFALGERPFFANVNEPSVPAPIASKVQSVIGLSNLARPQRDPQALKAGLDWLKTCATNSSIANAGNVFACTIGYFLLAIVYDIGCLTNFTINCTLYSPNPFAFPTSATMRASAPIGTGQKIGLVQFDSFHPSDVSDFLALTQAPATRINQLSSVAVNGGTPVGADESEVLLDIDTVMTLAPGATYVVYSAPFSGGGSFQAVFNRAISDGVTIISNSWAYCEDQTTPADVQSIDAILATAAAAGITVLSASGDSGSSCLDGSANTIAVPAGAPHATAVGGTSATYGPGGAYVSETWWDGSATTPRTGQGGFGVSRFFARPAFQAALNPGPARSIPDLAVNSDPRTVAVSICQASAGGCPSPLIYGGTSIAAPEMAAFIAGLNHARGSNVGWLNPLLYPLAGTAAFHSPASMGSDFAHVGLGSPNFSFLKAALDGVTPGPPSASVSIVRPVATHVAADGTVTTSVVVQLRDASGRAVSGKTVSLAANPSGSVVITPASGQTTTGNGSIAFSVKDATVETVTFTATDTTDGIVITQTAVVSFDVPPAAAASIGANPTSVPNDGTSTTTITVLLKDSLNRPTPGKEVTISQGSGHSIISGPSPSVTDINGQIQFTATDTTPETVTYSATDVTDGDLAVPGSAIVTFSGSANTSCVATPPTAATGFAITPFATGFAARNFFFGNVNWGGCPGASNPTFLTNGSVYVANFPDGTLFKLGPQGGAATSGNLLAMIGPTLGQPTFGTDGRLYATRGSTGGGFTTGVILELDPVTGASIRTVMSNLTCPNGLAVDPLSGDLFFDDSCFGAGSDNPTLWRLRNPGSATPTLETYATLPATPNGWISFSPDGTMYVVSGYTNPAATVLKVSGTNKPQPATITPLTGVTSLFWVTVAETLPNGAAKSLIVLDNTTGLKIADITANPPTFTQLTNGQMSSGVIGPDGCIYSAASDTVFRIAPSSGSCTFASTSQAPGLKLSPVVATPNPTQGSQQTLSAQFVNVAVPSGTPVIFTITGANAQLRLGRTNANGVATIQYTGGFTGLDRIVATATVSATDYTSNQATVAWTGGPHVSGIALNTSASSALAGHSATLAASLVDLSVDPPVAIAGASVHFTVGSQSCNGVTDASGNASCSVSPPSTGTFTLTASFAGNGAHQAASVSEQFTVLTAGAQRTFVASFGVDTNPCTLSAPCRSFAQAMSRVAVGGEVIVLDSAGYGPFTIVQPVAIIAPPGVYAGISVFSGVGITVTAGSGKVTLRGLAINSLGGDVGIDFQTGDALDIDRTTITGFPTAGIRAQTNATASIHVRDSALRDNGIGADFSPLLSATGVLDTSIEGTRIERNATAVRFGGSSTSGVIRASFVTGGTKGVSISPSRSGAAAAIEIRRSTISGVATNGIETSAAAGATATVAIASSEIVQNGTGVAMSAGGNALATDTSIARNATGIAFAGGGTAVSVGDNRLFGNGANGAFTSTIAKQ